MGLFVVLFIKPLTKKLIFDILIPSKRDNIGNLDMAKKANFTFKLHPKETGLGAVGHPFQSCDIKLNKQTVGTIHAPTWMTKGNEFSVSFTVKHKDPAITYCDWKWVRLKHTTASLDDMKAWLKANIDTITTKLELHAQED